MFSKSANNEKVTKYTKYWQLNILQTDTDIYIIVQLNNIILVVYSCINF